MYDSQLCNVHSTQANVSLLCILLKCILYLRLHPAFYVSYIALYNEYSSKTNFKKKIVVKIPYDWNGFNFLGRFIYPIYFLYSCAL